MYGPKSIDIEGDWRNGRTALLHCAVESHPTPDDSRGSSSPSRSISGVLSHVADGGSAPVPHECVQPYLSWCSSPSRSIHSPEVGITKHEKALDKLFIIAPEQLSKLLHAFAAECVRH